MPEELRATVLKILFANADTDYAVLRVEADGEEHTVRGPLAGLGPGASACFEGVWEEHAGYGRQFAASGYELILPVTEKGIAGFLSSGVLPGIGREKAGKIVRAFGRETLDIIDRYPGRLAEIPGISKKQLPKLIAAWKKLRDERSSMVFFQELGISRRTGLKLMRELGPGAAGIVKEEPYRLASEVSGIGFLKADAIASKLGIAADSPMRIAAGIVYQLEQTASRGHTCYPLEELVSGAANLLGVSGEAAAEGAARLAESRRIVVEDGMVWLPALRIAERRLAAGLLRLAGESFPEETVSDADGGLNPEQLAAVASALSSGVSIVTGGPGTGKTTVVGEIVRRAEDRGWETVLAAPTGRAAKRLSEASGRSAKTIHRFLGVNPGAGGFVHDASNPLEADLVIVDEVSMLDVELAAALVSALRPGVRLLLAGDADQLPSVGPGRVMADVIASGKFPVNRLVRVYRQQGDSGIIANAARVNSGLMPHPAAGRGGPLEEFYWVECEEPTRAAELVLRLVTERIPERFHFNPVEDVQVLTPTNRGLCGIRELNRILREKLNPGSSEAGTRPGDCDFRSGDKVMQIVNDYDRNVFNGDLGRVTEIHPGERKFTVLFDGDRPVEYDFDSAGELRPAYAATVHKAQGAEFPAVVMVMMPEQYMMLERRMLYTAITRARKLFVLIAPARAVAMAVKNYRSAPRYSELEKLLRKG